MKKMGIVISMLICLYSCHSQDSNKQINTKEYSNIVEIYMFPTSCVDDVRYSIYVKNDSLVFIDYEPTTGTEQCTNYIKKLSNYEKEKIDSLISLISSPIRNINEVEDAWGARMVINGKNMYEETDFSFDEEADFSFDEETNEMFELINYIISLSPKRPELYGFS